MPLRSGTCAAVAELYAPHQCRRTAASASAHVAWGLSVQAVLCLGSFPSGGSAGASSATTEERPNRQGGRSMARSDHGRGVSRLRWLRLSSKVVSLVPRLMNGCTTARGRSWGQVEQSARGSKRPVGSCTSPQRLGRTGWPIRYHTAVPLVTSSSRRRPLYQRTRTRGQLGCGSCRTGFSGGQRSPCTRGRPLGPRRRGGAGSYKAASSRRGATKRTSPRAQAPPHAWTRDG
jgi:hypothetical protein